MKWAKPFPFMNTARSPNLRAAPRRRTLHCLPIVIVIETQVVGRRQAPHRRRDHEVAVELVRKQGIPDGVVRRLNLDVAVDFELGSTEAEAGGRETVGGGDGGGLGGDGFIWGGGGRRLGGGGGFGAVAWGDASAERIDHFRVFCCAEIAETPRR